MTKYTITEALLKLKITSKKITDAVEELLVGFTTTNSKTVVPVGFKNQEEFKKEAGSRIDRVSDLIRFRDRLKGAIVSSNATTRVKVGQQEMTVAEAVERKQSITFKKLVLSKLQSNLVTLENGANQRNSQLDRQADEFIKGLTTAAESDRLQMRKTWIESNLTVLVTADNLRSTIEKLQNEIEEFETNVDVALSVSNARTEIEV